MEAALVRVDGYESKKANVETQEVVVTYDPKQTTPEALAKAINEHTEFKASVKKA